MSHLVCLFITNIYLLFSHIVNHLIRTKCKEMTLHKDGLLDETQSEHRNQS